ncbi:hypothetical protein EW026_g1318 [Hermanssonia centrifuga]|uniref:Uncharacterized protein n=1 Tax=Hermanssonia centrifuga TaxID=98765 RepID=A0A4S4KWF4_9APHY|nr:hypothetical protein EW026_g1318 [Hermanssonia centrifuga]
MSRSPNTLGSKPFPTMPAKMASKKKAKDTDKTETEKEALAVVSTEPASLSVLKAVREFEHDRHLTRRAAERKEHQARKGLMNGVITWSAYKYSRTQAAEAAQRMRGLHGKGGWHIKLVDDVDVADVIESDWVATVESRPEVTEVPLAELVKPGKARKARRRGIFIVLEDSAAPEPEADDPWECVDWDEDDPDGDHTARRAPSYAEVVATAI